MPTHVHRCMPPCIFISPWRQRGGDCDEHRTGTAGTCLLHHSPALLPHHRELWQTVLRKTLGFACFYTGRTHSEKSSHVTRRQKWEIVAAVCKNWVLQMINGCRWYLKKRQDCIRRELWYFHAEWVYHCFRNCGVDGKCKKFLFVCLFLHKVSVSSGLREVLFCPVSLYILVREEKGTVSSAIIW